jgi:hypothetical protein
MATKKKAVKKATAKPKAKKIAATKSPVKKKALKKAAVAAAAQSGINIDITFTNSTSNSITATLFSDNGTFQKTITSTGNILFPNVSTGDTIDIGGTTSGTAKLFTNRNTRPATTQAAPLTFTQTIITKTLRIL